MSFYDALNKTKVSPIVSIIFVLLIGFLSFYVNNARIQINDILEIDQALHDLLFIDKEIDSVLHKDMKFYNYDTIKDLSERMIDKTVYIKNINIDVKDENIKSQTENIKNSVSLKLELLEDFKSSNSILNNSYRYISILYKQLNPNDYDKKYTQMQNDILVNILSLSNDNTISLSSVHQKLYNMRSKKYEQITENRYFLLHAKIVLEYYLKIQELRFKSKSLNLSAQIEELTIDYDKYSENLLNGIGFVIMFFVVLIITFLIVVLRFGHHLEVTVKLRTRELKHLNENLEERVRLEVEKSTQQEKQMVQQSRSAAMGEMMGAIIHQWKQPLNALSVANSGTKLALMVGDIPKEEIEKTTNIIEKQIGIMNSTMEDFRNFFKPQKLRTYNVNNSINDVINLIGKIYETSNVFIKVDLSDGVSTSGYPNELNQVIINILNNARDIIQETNCEIRDIFVKTFTEDDKVVITISDCAGGVPEDIIDKIFEPYVTTKSDDKGTGIGLDMSKTIVEKVNGSISVKNVVTTIDEIDYSGAQFRIELNLTQS